MKRYTLWRRAFTLIELLVVMVVMCILAGLVLSGARSAMLKGYMSRAQTEISGLELACESFKADNGDYPRFLPDAAAGAGSASDKLNAKTTPPPKTVQSTESYASASLILYSNLSGDITFNGVGGQTDPNTQAKWKVYYEFRPNMLFPNPAQNPGKTIVALVDPWKLPYGYSTINESETQSSSTGTPGVDGYNATFDLWSYVGIFGTSAGGSPDVSLQWIKNW